jgi:hypothetical protein
VKNYREAAVSVAIEQLDISEKFVKDFCESHFFNGKSSLSHQQTDPPSVAVITLPLLKKMKISSSYLLMILKVVTPSNNGG